MSGIFHAARARRRHAGQATAESSADWSPIEQHVEKVVEKRRVGGERLVRCADEDRGGYGKDRRAGAAVDQRRKSEERALGDAAVPRLYHPRTIIDPGQRVLDTLRPVAKDQLASFALDQAAGRCGETAATEDVVTDVAFLDGSCEGELKAFPPNERSFKARFESLRIGREPSVIPY